jgi:rhomboid family GlyGly-CTERM serine protease
MPAPSGSRLAPPLYVAVVGAALMLLLQAAPSLPAALEYRRELLAGEPWRLLSAHFVHVNQAHALANAAAWLLLAPFFAPVLGARRQLLVVALGGVLVAAGLAAFYPAIVWYRGASGALHALFFAGAAAAFVAATRARHWRDAALPALLLAAAALKVALELPQGASTPYAGWLATTTVPQAHLLGALAGAALGVLLGAAPPAAVSRAGGG